MLSVARGTCYSIFVYDVAFAINLEGAERLTSATRETIKRKRQAPKAGAATAKKTSRKASSAPAATS